MCFEAAHAAPITFKLSAHCIRCAAGCMGGNKLDAAAVRKLEKLPTKTQMIGSVAIMVKKVMILLYTPADTFVLF